MLFESNPHIHQHHCLNNLFKECDVGERVDFLDEELKNVSQQECL